MSRLTFREQVDVCWQKQLRDKFLDEGTPPVPYLDLKRAMVRTITREMAKQIIFKYEWLGTMGPGASKFYGIFFGNYCAGVTCVSLNGSGTAGPFMHRQFNIERKELTILVRGACVHWAPPGTNSRIVSMTTKLLSKEGGGKWKIILAFADTDAGEIGTIYQACNWFYIGKTHGVVRGDMQYVSPNGKILNRMILREVAEKNKTTTKKARHILLNNGYKEQPANAKHKYVQILDKTDKALCDRIKRMSLPYPKRQASEAGDGPDHGHSGGAAPTRTLQSDKDPCK